MYSLRILFFTLPIYFSHVFAPLGVVVGDTSSFERQKVYLFLFLLLCAYIEQGVRSPQRIGEMWHKYLSHILVLLVLPFVSAFYFGMSIDIDWLMGGHEKHHGYLLYMGVITLAPLLISGSRVYLRSYLSWSMYAASIVAIVAIGEHIGGILDIYHRGEMVSMYSGRSMSTLGNPNYLAGYLLMLLPLSLYIRTPERWIVSIILILALLTTGSYIAIALISIYVLYMLGRYVHMSSVISLIVVSIATLIGIYIGSLYLDPDKILSLTSRFVLMRETLVMMLQAPVSFLVGFGPDSILTHFSQGRSALTENYFPSNMLIDSSHDVYIDILFQYGILPLLLIARFLYLAWQGQKEELQIAIALGGVFLSLNVFVVVHILILALLLAMLYQGGETLSRAHDPSAL